MSEATGGGVTNIAKDTGGEFVCSVSELRYALANAIPFAAKSEPPSLAGVRLELADGILTVTATDTVALIRQHIHGTDDTRGDFAVTVPLGDAKAVLASAKAIPVPDDEEQGEMFPREASVRVGSGKVTVVLDRMLDSIRHVIVPFDVEAGFPDAQKLWPTDPEPMERLAMFFKGGAEAARLGKVVDPDFPKKRVPVVLVFHGPLKPVLFTVGERVRGLLVPARMDSKGMDG